MADNNDDFNDDERVAPAWIDAKFLATILRNCQENSSDLKVQNYKISPATAKGDHYASIMFRANVEYQSGGANKTKSLIIKTMPEEEGHKKNMLKNTYIFETEIGTYTEVLPRFEQMLRDVGDDTILKAPCLYHQLSPHKVIVFEDIVPLGYDVMRDRWPSAEEAKAAYHKLATWHAISYKINIEEPKCFDEYRHGVFSMSSLATDPIVTDGIKNFIAAFKGDPKFGKYIPYFEKLQPELLNKCRQIFREYRESPQPDDLYVLSHGDFHLKNMMFKHNAKSGKLEDVMLLDFQVSYVGSIVLDLMYSKFFLLSDKMLDDWTSYFEVYLTRFNETLQKLGFKGPLPKILQINELMKRHKYYEFFLIVTFLPMWLGVMEHLEDLTEILLSPDLRLQLYKNKYFVARLERLLPKYEQLGYFDD